MENKFKRFDFKFSDVRPSQKDLADFLQLEKLDEDHPALVFLEEILPSLDNLGHIHGGYRIFDITGQSQAGLTLSTFPGISETFDLGVQVKGYLKGSEYAALFICTAGEEFNSMIDHFNGNGDILEAYLVDAIGSLTVENAMDRIMDNIEKDWSDLNFKITNRYSPGYCNWHLAEQQKLFRLLEGHDTDIQLTDSSLMLPTKSVSGIIGIGREARKRDYGCATCNNTTCIYRKILHQT